MDVPARNTRQEGQVWDRLARVADPELDEPITDMGFVERVAIVGREAVEVDFRLPTYWCSPNFAFLMADGIRREVGSLPWVRRVRVRLHDHMFAERVNNGVNEAQDFADIFRELSDGDDLDAVRAKFEEKAFQRRQECLIEALVAEGFPASGIVAMTLADLDAHAFADTAAAAQKPRYRALLLELGLAWGSDDLAFRRYDGSAITEAGFAEHMAALRAVRINMEFNGALCRGLQGTRYKEVDRSGKEPELVDFILGRVPPRADRPGQTMTN
ncbi:iron-sulfur cluster assembly protein [Rhodobacteraceae bacterium DSL-40]|uniref:iron-sulfur cluster assembly protein n=1 Tax=Amaricoccus sp. B4 TaxID=3368557 RepID=UPI000DAD239F